MATGCELELSWLGNGYESVRTNPTLGALYESNLEALGRSAIPQALVQHQAASTDMGNVSRVVPSIHPWMSIDSLPAVNHQREFADHAISPAGDKAVLDAALVLAWTVIDLATARDALDRIKEEWKHPSPE